MATILEFTLPVPPQEFWALVRVGSEAECWEWVGYRRDDGYGELSRGARKGRVRYRSHRLAWELANGPIPNGLFVCHKCDHPPCCNPRHLFLGTVEDNFADMFRKGRHRNGSVGKTVCKRGHPLDGANVYVNKRGFRSCRTCERARHRRYHHAVRKHKPGWWKR